MVDGKRPPIVVWLVPIMIGLVGFFRVIQSPSFATYRAVDIVQLLGSGVCFGAANGGDNLQASDATVTLTP
jgi:hypothetical protein